MPAPNSITVLLKAAGEGDQAASTRLVDLVYPELKRLARHASPGRLERTLNTTALVHECYLRLSKAAGMPGDHAHLLALSVRIMLLQFQGDFVCRWCAAAVARASNFTFGWVSPTCARMPASIVSRQRGPLPEVE